VNGSNLKSATPVESTEVTMTSTDVHRRTHCQLGRRIADVRRSGREVRSCYVARTGDNSAAVAARFGARTA